MSEQTEGSGAEDTGDADKQLSFLDMSDDDFMSQGGALLDSMPLEEDATPLEAESSELEDGDGEQDTEEVADGSAGEEDEDLDDEDIDVDSGTSEDDATVDSDPDSSDDTDDSDAGTDDDSDASDDDTSVDYKAELEKLYAPFKANGKDMRVQSVEDAKQLMQMGANYNKKMAGLKPVMALVKMLEKNDLADEEKLSFLIDVSKKDPAAIAKLLKDSEIDPLEMDMDSADAYKAGDHKVDTREVELDEVLGELKETPTFNQTISTVDGWDKDSKAAVANDPNLLRQLNTQMSNGVYDVISTTIESERMFGRLQGLSDIEAYQAVGQHLQNTGGFDHLFKQEGQQQPKDQEMKPDTRKDQRRDKRRAASPTKKASTGKKPANSEYSPLSLSDEEFLKVGDSKFL